MDDGDSTARRPADNTVAVFLSLFLLLLAFFIVLTVISQREQRRTELAIDSIAGVFRGGAPALRDETAPSGGAMPGPATRFQEEMRQLIEATLPIVKAETVKHGGALRITVPAYLLFRPGNALLQPRAQRLVEGIAAGLAASGYGVHNELELLLGAGPALPQGPSPGDALPLQRAGSFARALEQAGAPARATMIGLRVGNPADVQLTFYRHNKVGWVPPAPADGR